MASSSDMAATEDASASIAFEDEFMVRGTAMVDLILRIDRPMTSKRPPTPMALWLPTMGRVRGTYVIVSFDSNCVLV